MLCSGTKSQASTASSSATRDSGISVTERREEMEGLQDRLTKGIGRGPCEIKYSQWRAKEVWKGGLGLLLVSYYCDSPIELQMQTTVTAMS